MHTFANIALAALIGLAPAVARGEGCPASASEAANALAGQDDLGPVDAACDADCPEGRKLGGKGLRVLGAEPSSVRRESMDGRITALAITLPGGGERYVAKFQAHHLGAGHGGTGQCTEQDCSWQRQQATAANGELMKADLLPVVFGDDETLLFCWYAQ